MRSKKTTENTPMETEYWCANCFQYYSRDQVGFCLGSTTSYWVCDDCRLEDDYEWCEKHQAYHLGDCAKAYKAWVNKSSWNLPR